MKRRQPGEFGQPVQRFFEQYLPALRGMSLHTIHSYRDAMVLFLHFLARDLRRRVETLEIADLTAPRVEKFLTSLEAERHNSIATRNARLAAVHTFARFLAAERPAHLARLQAITLVPFKRGGREAPIEYFEAHELDAVPKSIDQKSARGSRDYALFALMFNTGGRVQEILNLRVRDIRLDPPYQVRLLGKGNKTRLCPIWPATAKHLRTHIEQQLIGHADPGGALVFTNRNGGHLPGSVCAVCYANM